MNKKLLNIFSILGVALAFTGCVRNDNYFSYDQSSPNRKQVVKIANGGDIVTIARDVNPTIDTFAVIDLRREPNTAAELNQPLTVKLVKDATLITDYNTANGTSYIELPSDSYTVLGDLNSITFAPGEDIKQIKIRLNKTNLDLSEQYALGFSIADAGGAVINTSLGNGLYAIGVKNKYDGHYLVTGTMVDAANATLSGPYPWDVYLITSGPNQVLLYDNEYTFDIFHKISSGGANSYYGAFGVVINFDPATDKVTSVVNYYGQPASNGRSAELDPSGINQFNAATKTLDIKYWMNQPSVITPHRTSFDEHFEYLGPR